MVEISEDAHLLKEKEKGASRDHDILIGGVIICQVEIVRRYVSLSK